MALTRTDLEAEFGKEKANNYIRRVESYARATGKRYKNNIAMARKWLLEDGHKPRAVKAKEEDKPYHYWLDLCKKYRRLGDVYGRIFWKFEFPMWYRDMLVKEDGKRLTLVTMGHRVPFFDRLKELIGKEVLIENFLGKEVELINSDGTKVLL